MKKAAPLNYAKAVSHGELNKFTYYQRNSQDEIHSTKLKVGSTENMINPTGSTRGRRAQRSPVSPTKGIYQGRSRGTLRNTTSRTGSVSSVNSLQTNESETINIKNSGNHGNSSGMINIPNTTNITGTTNVVTTGTNDYTLSPSTTIPVTHRRNSSIQSNRSSLSPCHQNQTVYPPYAYHTSPYLFVPQSYPGNAYNTTGMTGYPSVHSGHANYAQRNLSGLSNTAGHTFNAMSSPPMVSSQTWQSINQHYFYQSGYDQSGFYQPLYGLSPHSFMMPMGSYTGMLYPYSGQSFQPTTSYPSTQSTQMAKSVSSVSDCPAPSTLTDTNVWPSQASTDESTTTTTATTTTTTTAPVSRPQKRVNAAVKIVNPKTNMEISISPTQPILETKEIVPPLALNESDKEAYALSMTHDENSEVLTESTKDSTQDKDQQENLEKGISQGQEQVIENVDCTHKENQLCVQSEEIQSVAQNNIERKSDSEIEEKESSIIEVKEPIELTDQEKEDVIEINKEKGDIETVESKESVSEHYSVCEETELFKEKEIEEKEADEKSTFYDPELSLEEDKDLKVISEEMKNPFNTQSISQSEDFNNIDQSQNNLSVNQSNTKKQLLSSSSSSSSSSNEKTKHKILPTPLDLSKTSRNNTHMVSVSIASLKNATFITDLTTIIYPDKFKPPDKSLNINSLPGRFKYDEEFLLQFQKVYKDKPDYNWEDRIRDTIGDGTDDKKTTKSTLGGLSSRSISRSIGVSITSIPIGSFGLNKAPSNKSSSNQHCQHNNAQTQQNSDNLTSNSLDEPAGLGNKFVSNSKSMLSSGVASNDSGSPVVSRFSLAGSNNSVSSGFSMSGSVSPVTPKMSSRKGGSRRGAGLSQSESKNDKHDQKSGSNAPVEHVVPLALSANRWQPKLKSQTIQPGEHMDPEMVQRKVKAALNKLTVDNFDRITDQILEIASQSKNETDGRTLRQIIQLTFEKATDEANFSSMYARFCRKMMETTSPEIRDEKLQLDKNGRPITGGILFRKYLLNRCQENFERGWKANLPSKPNGDPSNAQEAEMLSDEYYVLVTAKRRGLGLIKFIGELFKLNMLTERIMHECIKKLLANVVDPDEEEIEGLCKLLATIGRDLESTEKGHLHMNVYIERMDKIVKTSNLSNRIKFMVMDILDLRKTGWKSKNADKGPKTIAEIHEDIAKEKAEAEATRLVNQNRGSRLEFGRMDKSMRSNTSLFGIPDWQNPKNSSSVDSKVGDLSRLGQIRSSNQRPYGPGGQLSSLRSLSESKKSMVEPQDFQKESSHLSQTSIPFNITTTSEQKPYRNIVLLPKTEYVQQNNNKQTALQESSLNTKKSGYDSSSLNVSLNEKSENSKEDLILKENLTNLEENLEVQIIPVAESEAIVQDIDSDEDTTLKEHLADSEQYEIAPEKFTDSEESPIA
ncbi:hypothetical protein PCANB_000773 [Pneumocystis canis]|nr:hypothetical protein PCANB_000773 [Pneumocystis canis]